MEKEIKILKEFSKYIKEVESKVKLDINVALAEQLRYYRRYNISSIKVSSIKYNFALLLSGDNVVLDDKDISDTYIDVVYGNNISSNTLLLKKLPLYINGYIIIFEKSRFKASVLKVKHIYKLKKSFINKSLVLGLKIDNPAIMYKAIENNNCEVVEVYKSTKTLE